MGLGCPHPRLLMGAGCKLSSVLVIVPSTLMPSAQLLQLLDLQRLFLLKDFIYLSFKKLHLGHISNMGAVKSPTSTPGRARLSATTTKNIPKSLFAFSSMPLTTHLYLITRALSSTTFFLFLLLLQQSLYASALLLRQSYYTSLILSRQGYYGSLLLAKQTYWLGRIATRRGWKGTEKLRNKLFFELAVFVLGTSGNGVLLLMFWPGWIVIGGVLWLGGKVVYW